MSGIASHAVCRGDAHTATTRTVLDFFYLLVEVLDSLSLVCFVLHTHSTQRGSGIPAVKYLLICYQRLPLHCPPRGRTGSEARGLRGSLLRRTISADLLRFWRGKVVAGKPSCCTEPTRTCNLLGGRESPKMPWTLKPRAASSAAHKRQRLISC